MQKEYSAWNRLTPDWIVILILSLIKLSIHLFTNTSYELHRDEYLYLAFADHLDFGYFSNAPFIGIMALLTQSLLGHSVFAIRFFPALLGACSIIVLSLLVKQMGGKKWAIVLAGSALILSPAFLRVNWLLQPVSFDLFFWLLATYFMLRLIKTANPKYWLVLGFIWGLGFLTKYLIALLPAGFLIALLLTGQRKLLYSKYFFYHLLIGFLLIVPNLIWQYNHNWPVAYHMQNLQQTQLVNVQVVDFLAGQFLMTLPAVPVWVAGLLYLLFFKESRSYSLLGFVYVLVLLLLMLLHGKAYYALGMYYMLMAAGAVLIEKYSAGRRAVVLPVLIIAMIGIDLPALPYSLPILPFNELEAYGQKTKEYGLAGALRWEDGRIHTLPQDYADMTGWKELAGIVISAFQKLSPAEQAACIIFAENYGQAGAVKYFSRGMNVPEPLSFSDNFLFWIPDTIRIHTLIYINDDTADVAFYFQTVTEVGRITDAYAREQNLPVYLCQTPRNNFEQFYRETASRIKGQFRRNSDHQP
jgi:hypothetical protein